MAYEPMRLPFQPQWLAFHFDYLNDRLQQTANVLGREIVYDFNGNDYTFIPKTNPREDYVSFMNNKYGIAK
jgi:hypothetical protein